MAHGTGENSLKREANLDPLRNTVGKQAQRSFGKDSPLTKMVYQWASAVRKQVTKECPYWDPETVETLKTLCTDISAKIRKLPANATEGEVEECLIPPQDVKEQLAQREQPDEDGFVSHLPPNPSSSPRPSHHDAPYPRLVEVGRRGLVGRPARELPALPVPLRPTTPPQPPLSPTLRNSPSPAPPPRPPRHRHQPPPHRTCSPPLPRRRTASPPRQLSPSPAPPDNSYAYPPPTAYGEPTKSSHPYYRQPNHWESDPELDSDGEPILTDYYRSLTKNPSVTDRTAKRYRYRDAAHWRAAQGW